MGNYGFIETLFDFKVDPIRVVHEQAVCTVCGSSGFHAHKKEINSGR